MQTVSVGSHWTARRRADISDQPVVHYIPVAVCQWDPHPRSLRGQALRIPTGVSVVQTAHQRAPSVFACFVRPTATGREEHTFAKIPTVQPGTRGGEGGWW